MNRLELDWDKVDKIVDNALEEDVGVGDVTTDAICPVDSMSKAEIRAKDKGVIAGGPIAERVFNRLSPEALITLRKEDGERVMPGDVIFQIEAPTRAILTGERLALNILQRLSGIATETSKYVKECEGYKAKILDTRKTAPGLRVLDKYAVSAGGGLNHRIGLYDGVLIKDNHIASAGTIAQAVRAVRKKHGGEFKIEVETSNFGQVREALDSGAEVIMLDNMSIEDMREAVSMIGGKALVEASGGVTLDTVRGIAETGVDYISAGYLTHSAKALDMALYLVY
jgi:nicotinate-nucleotide pyrophosphorylase (carboxylating)